MSKTSYSLRANIEAQARNERLKTKPVKHVQPTVKISQNVGLISQQKLSKILGDQKQSPKPLQISENITESLLPILSDPSPPDAENRVEEAVQRLIALNKDKLSEAQLVDLIASFYFVTNQCSKLGNNDAPVTMHAGHRLLEENMGTDPISNDLNKTSTDNFTSICDADVCEFSNTSGKSSPSVEFVSLREQKRLQWMQERAELERLEVLGRCGSLVNLRGDCGQIATNSAQPQQQILSGDETKEITKSAPPVRGHHRFQRKQNYGTCGGLAIGEESLELTALKEKQRLQWLADLDRQIEEKRLAREREKVAMKEPPCSEHLPVYLRQDTPLSTTERCTPIQHPHSSPHSAGDGTSNFVRGRGMADLLGRRDDDSADTKRHHQNELRAVYAEQMREKAERVRKEKERDAREESLAVARAEADVERLRQEKEVEMARKRETAQMMQKAMLEAQEKARQEMPRSRPVPSDSQRRASTSHQSDTPSRLSRQSSGIGSANRRPGAMQRSVNAHLGTTYTLSSQINTSNPKRRGRSHLKMPPDSETEGASECVEVVRTESSLLPSPPVSQNLVPQSIPTSDFLSAIVDPDYNYPRKSPSPPRPSLTDPTVKARNSALQQVSRIKENLALRQNELRSMLRVDDHFDDPRDSS